ncbi:MAG: APC family permease [Candidatus Binataceae bacterium]
MGLVAAMYLVVSGGAYGLEDAVRTAGPRLTLLLCIVVPLTLSLPTALMAAELTALMPVEGGFYFWVKEAFGPFAGFAEAYLTILYIATDTAIYPVLFAAYLGFLFPIGTAGEIALGIALIWLAGALNLMGVRPVGVASTAMTALILAPFGVLVALGMPRLVHWHLPAGSLVVGDFAGALGAGLTVIIWNFSGWENLSVISAEIENPRRNYARAIAVAIPLVTLGYLLPLMVGVSGAGGSGEWTLGWFTHVGSEVGGPMLGGAIAIGGALSAVAVFQAAMLWVSRMPFVLARERYLAPRLADVWLRTATPWKSIVACCVGFTFLAPLGFVALVVMDVFFYMGAVALEMGALIRLRRTRPGRDGLFTIGYGRPALYLTALAPLVTWLATFGLVISKQDGKSDFIIAVALALGVWPAYALLRRRYGGPPA